MYVLDADTPFMDRVRYADREETEQRKSENP